jgi:large subunit ribosomal protein L10
MARSDKEAAVASLTTDLQESNAVLVTEYRGLTVGQLTELRTTLGRDTRYTVAKNTLVRRAVADAGIDGVADLLSGPTALALVSGDPVEAAKSLRDFAKRHPMLVVKGGVMDGKALSPEEVGRIADLESREVLLAKLAGGMNASLARAAGMFAAPLSQVARLASGLQEQKAAEAAPAD